MTLPPGPSAPISVQSMHWTVRPIAMLERCARRYGDAFTIRLAGAGDVVVLSDPAAVKEVFTGDPDVLHAGEANAILEPVVGRHSLLLLDGPQHLRQRKLMLPPFHGARMQRYGEVMRSATEREMERWPQGEPFALRERTQAITLEVIMRAVFGIEDAERLEELRAPLAELLDVSSRRFAVLILGALRAYTGPGSPWHAFERASRRVDTILFEEIARRRADPDVAEREDVLSMLLSARDEHGDTLSDQELRDELMTMLVAGHETTATALAWTWERLLRRPAILARLEREVSAGEGDAYLDAVVKEALRLRPVIMMVMRRLTRPLTVAGLELPAGTNVGPCIYLVHRRPEVYANPAEFRPERFLESPPDTYSWIPFGGGIRRCVGAAFAQYEMKVVLRTMVERAQLRAARPRFERPRRRSITLAPAEDGQVVLEGLRMSSLGDKDAAKAPETAPAAV
jgi:cytochrome P450